MTDSQNPMTDGTPPEQQFFSLAFLIMMLQKPPAFVMELAKQAGVQPRMHVDGVPHFRGDDVVKMSEYLKQLRQYAASAASN